jgi:hypothetical protein
MPTLARTAPTTPESLARDRAVLLRLSLLEQQLKEADAALDDACCATPPEEARARFSRVTRAYDALVAAAEAGYRVSVGPTAGQRRQRVLRARQQPEARRWLREVQRLRTARQEHLLRPCLVTHEPVTVVAGSYQAYGPRIAGMTS